MAVAAQVSAIVNSSLENEMSRLRMAHACARLHNNDEISEEDILEAIRAVTSDSHARMVECLQPMGLDGQSTTPLA